MIINKCATCPLLFTSKRARSYCSQDCHRRAVAHEVAERLAEFHWIAGTDTWENVARRLRFPTRTALERWLDRLGELHWAREVHEDRIRERQGRWAN